MRSKIAYAIEAEPQLLQQAANGSREAYAILYRHYLPKLYKYLYEIVRSKKDAEEILQDVGKSYSNERAFFFVDLEVRFSVRYLPYP